MKIELNDMQETNELLNLVLENINSAVFLVDEHARITNINNPGTILFSKQASSMIGGFAETLLVASIPISTKLIAVPPQNAVNAEFGIPS